MSKHFDNLKLSIAAVIKNNGVNEIDGQVLQERLLAMVDAMELSNFDGFATPETEPETDATCDHYYLAVEEGVYENFDSYVVTRGDVVIFEKRAGESQWRKTNVSAGVKEMISDLDNGKQDKMTSGAGIDINGNVVSVKTGDGLQTDEDGNLVVDAEYVKSEAEDVVEEQKQSGDIVAPGEDGKIDMSLLPDNMVLHDEEELTPDEMIDEFERVLGLAYQGITDLKVAKKAAEDATRRLGEALSESGASTERANNAARRANEGADAVNGAIARLNEAVNRANQQVTEAYARIIDINNAIRNCTEITTQCARNSEAAFVNAGYAKEQGDYALEKGGYANTQGAYAKEQGDYAKEQGDYAKGKGDFAQAVMDSAKGGYSDLNARLNAMESMDIVVVEDNDPTHLLD